MNVKLNDTVFFIEHWTGNVIKGTVTEILEDGVRIDCDVHVDEAGNDIDTAYGTSGARFDKIYASAKDAYTAKKQDFDKKTSEYCDKIRTVQDLVQFPLEHCLCGEEYTDYPAIAAYRRRAKELTGTDL